MCSATVEAIIVGGTAQMRDSVVNDLDEQLRSYVVGTYTWVDNDAERFFESVQEDIAQFEVSHLCCLHVIRLGSLTQTAQLERERVLLKPFVETLAKSPELLEFGATSIESALSLLSTVFVDSREHPQLAARLAADAPTRTVVIRHSDALDDYGGIVAIKHMP